MHEKYSFSQSFSAHIPHTGMADLHFYELKTNLEEQMFQILIRGWRPVVHIFHACVILSAHQAYLYLTITRVHAFC